ncbi:MAG TPA: hypothetical protein VFS96_01785 [Nitrolancea sp.]|nr:hypothetical protein [Nitrolancea sp.]
MKRRRVLAVVVGTVVIGGLYILVSTKQAAAKASTPFKPHALTGLSDQEKAQYALDYVQANFTNGVPPKIRFAQTLTPAQMYDLGLVQPASTAVERQIPMYTVVLQGEFTMERPGGGASAPGAGRVAGKTFRFLQLSFDDTVGMAATLVANPDGRGWGDVLHDPSLPPYPGPRPPRMEDVIKWVKEHCPEPKDPAHPSPCPPMPASLLNPSPSPQQ